MIAGVLLAAGASSRMGRDKALVRSGRDSFLVSGVRHLWAICDRVVVVLGSHHAEIRRGAEEEFALLVSRRALERDFGARLTGGSGRRGIEVHFIVHAGWKKGMLSSVRAGLKDALLMRPESVLVLPVDHPDVQPATVMGLALHLELVRRRAPARQRANLLHALIPRYEHRRGHPVALTSALAARIVADRTATDLSDAIRRHASEVTYQDVDDPGVVRNRNRPRD
ncbi:MAG TPA: NTP transferase domain-containing protein [Candidatus Udaeobacter sp.]|jgi:molybdenum cofactor cytidylyltransferase|nr:NTP transferase domain-containing protein [Candidatus Udaeobacter sp.]